MESMKIVFRADASAKIGSGHLSRCVALATQLRALGAETAFASRRQPGDRCDWLERLGFRLIPLGSGSHGEVGDAALTIQAVRDIGIADWIVLDHYDLGVEWQRALRSHCRRLMVIDDSPGREHECDLLLDQNSSGATEVAYRKLVGRDCRLLLGPRFALLSPEYEALRRQTKVRRGPVRRVLVTFGGADPADATSKVMRALASIPRGDVQTDVVLGPSYKGRNVAEELASRMGRTTVHFDLPSLAPLMGAVDLAIGGGGTTSWERCCLGLPSLVLTLAENQRAVAKQLEAAGAASWLGDVESMDEARLAVLIDTALSGDGLEAMSGKAMALVDGMGARRVMSALLDGGEVDLRLRSIRQSDEKLLLQWANDPLVRSNGFYGAQISGPEHHAWFRRRLDDPENCCLLIADLAVGTAVGMVRFERSTAGWAIGYSVAADFRGIGLGRRMLALALDWHAVRHPRAGYIARVKSSNQASRKVFGELGFHQTGAAQGVIEFRHDGNAARALSRRHAGCEP